MHPTLLDGLGVQGPIRLDTVRVTGIRCRPKDRMTSVDTGINDMNMTTATRHPVIIVRADGLGDARQEAETGAKLGRERERGSRGRAGRGREGGEERGRNISRDFFCEGTGTWGKQTKICITYECFCVYDSANGNIKP